MFREGGVTGMGFKGKWKNSVMRTGMVWMVNLVQVIILAADFFNDMKPIQEPIGYTSENHSEVNNTGLDKSINLDC